MLWTVAKEAAQNWSSHKDARQGAALAYYSVFSLGPLIVIAIAIAGFFFGREAVTGQVTSSITSLLGETGAKAIQAMLAAASRPREGLLATAIGAALLVLAAIGVVVQLKDALNTVWEVKEAPEGGIWNFVRTYVVSVAAVLAVGFLLLISLLVTTMLAAAGKYVAPYLPEWIFHVISLLVSFLVISGLFAMMFKWLPDVNVDWYDVWLGAILTALLFEVGKSAIGFYIGKQGLESTYGAAASIIVVLIWVYYSSQIILMGAEFTRAFAKQHGSKKNIEDGSSSERVPHGRTNNPRSATRQERFWMHLALAANAELAASSGPSLGSLLIDGSVRQLAQSGVGFLFFLQGLLQKLHGLGHAELFRPGDQRAVA